MARALLSRGGGPERTAILAHELGIAPDVARDAARRGAAWGLFELSARGAKRSPALFVSLSQRALAKLSHARNEKDVKRESSKHERFARPASSTTSRRR